MKPKRAIFQIILLAVLWSVCIGAKAQLHSFSGNWIINEQKSEFEGAPLFIASKALKVIQYSDSITIVRITAEDKDYTETLFFNGQQDQSSTPSKRIKTASIQWIEDGKGFTEPASYSKENGDPEVLYNLTE